MALTFQQIGGPSVTVWRELRRLKSSLNDPHAEQARTAADSGDWAAYVFAMGGVEFMPQKRPIESLHRYLTAIDLDTGEIISFTHTKYGDLKDKPIRGLLINGLPVITRTMAWAQGRRLMPVDSEVFSSLDDRPNEKTLSESTKTWTRVNNCTRVENRTFH